MKVNVFINTVLNKYIYWLTNLIEWVFYTMKIRFTNLIEWVFISRK